MIRRIRLLAIVSMLATSASCVWIVQGGWIAKVDSEAAGTLGAVESPIKAFMLDGSIVTYPAGARVTRDSILGPGKRFTLGLVDTSEVAALSLDSVVGVEAFHARVNAEATVLATLAATALGTVGAAGLAVAIFGSCPTFYASTEQGGLLQAEGFSFSIAPLLEARDLDALRLRPDGDGTLRLELRNEALETHYLNHLEVVAVDHAPGVRAIPDHRGMPLGVRDGMRPVTARDGSGRDVLSQVAEEDGRAFSSAEARFRSVTAGDYRDHVELTFDRPEGNEAVVVLRVRNSLLTTVLFYDLMLGRAGAAALDWIGRDMAGIGTVVELGKWFQGAMGMTVSVHDGREWVEVGRVPDVGPIAWEEMGVGVPLPPAGPVQVRLGFLADAWRIDQVTLARPGRLSGTARLPVARLLQDGSSVESDALARIAAPDDAYLPTYPGTTAQLEFDPPPLEPGLERSYLLSSQGYYTEWVRSTWIRDAERLTPFRPGEGTVGELMRLWLSKKESFESAFYESRIPVR